VMTQVVTYKHFWQFYMGNPVYMYFKTIICVWYWNYIYTLQTRILWKHFISWGRNFVVWRQWTYSWVLDFVDCPTHEIHEKKKNLQFLTDAKLRPNIKTESFAKLQISEWLCLLSYVTPEDIDPPQWVNVFIAQSHQTTFMTPNCQLARHLRDYIHKDAMDSGSFKGLIKQSHWLSINANKRTMQTDT